MKSLAETPVVMNTPSQPAGALALPFELVSLANAVNYQRWVFRTIEPFVGQRILEIGAGIGNMSQWLPIRERLILSETDPQLIGNLRENLAARRTLQDQRVSVLALDVVRDDLTAVMAEKLDTVVSFNVLEHIENDAEALGRLCDIVRANRSPGRKRVITFVPAHAWAYGSMDKTFGHFRRYSRSGLKNLCRKVAPEAKLTLRHFNAFGVAGWVWNGRVMKRPHIGSGAIRAFERLCPWLSPIDDFLHKQLRLPIGQSLLAVLEWQD